MHAGVCNPAWVNDPLEKSLTWRPRGLSKWVISRVISTLNGATLIITLLITDLLSPLGLQVVAAPGVRGPPTPWTLKYEGFLIPALFRV